MGDDLADGLPTLPSPRSATASPTAPQPPQQEGPAKTDVPPAPEAPATSSPSPATQDPGASTGPARQDAARGAADMPRMEDAPAGPGADEDPSVQIHDERPGPGSFRAAVAPRLAPEVAVQIGLWATIASLVTILVAKFFPGVASLFSRVAGADVPDHTARRAILNALAAHPYSGIQRIARDAGLTRSKCRHHMAVLEREGFVRAFQTATGRVYLLVSEVRRMGRAAAAPAQVALHDSAVQAALEALSDQPMRLSSVVAHVSARAGLSRVGAWKAIVRAERLGFVARQRVGTQVWLVPSPDPVSHG